MLRVEPAMLLNIKCTPGALSLQLSCEITRSQGQSCEIDVGLLWLRIAERQCEFQGEAKRWMQPRVEVALREFESAQFAR